MAEKEKKSKAWDEMNAFEKIGAASRYGLKTPGSAEAKQAEEDQKKKKSRVREILGLD